LGGVRAGKSAHAAAWAAGRGERVAFVATAEPLDPDMAARIAAHRAARPPGWATLEAPLALAEALADLRGKADVVVVDCLSLWVANLLGRDPAPDDDALRGETARLTAALAGAPFDVVLVSNEVGSGLHPETAIGRRFRDVLGTVNQAVAAVADEVILMVAGCPLRVKGSP
jgi:adenosyl cobinamide kinase/adenosyl cobinamide phosphate guanylyltransferase